MRDALIHALRPHTLAYLVPSDWQDDPDVVGVLASATRAGVTSHRSCMQVTRTRRGGLVDLSAEDDLPMRSRFTSVFPSQHCVHSRTLRKAAALIR